MHTTVADIPVEIVRKKIKYMHLYVLPPDGSVKVTAPLRLPEAAVRAFVKEKRGWIDKQRDRLRSRPAMPRTLCGEGDTLYLWGEPYTAQLCTGAENSVVLAHGKALIYTKEGTGAEQRGRFIREWYRARLMEKAVPCLRRWELATGLHSSELRTKYMKTRWGTCNTSAGRIWLNVELAKKPEECLRYVTLHELAHLKISGHGRDFKALLDRYMPDWREIRKRMNGSGN